MIKVLKKIFDILEFVAEHDRAVPTGEIAKELDLNLPTCSRILKDLASTGYVEQIAPKKGYILGPASYSLSVGKIYRRDIKEIVDPFVRGCARSLKESVLFAVFKNSKRYIISNHNGNPEIQTIIDRPFYEDTYVTAKKRSRNQEK
jgi:DNA-binding IclR family transcriptional regulator